MKAATENQTLKSETGISPWIVIGYLLSILGGVGGIVVGTIIISGKKAGPNGTIFIFNKQSRKQARIIVIIGSLVLVACLLFFLNWFFFEKLLFGKRPGD